MERRREAHLSTIEDRPQAAARLSRAHGDQKWPEGAGAAQSQGAQAPVGLTPLDKPSPPDAATVIGRLKARSEFLYVRNGKRFVTPGLVLQARARASRKCEGDGAPRFGFTATKRLGGAVVRNRARRRLKEAVRLAAPGHAADGYDYVLIARAGTLQRRFTELTRDLQRALAKVHEPPKAAKR